MPVFEDYHRTIIGYHGTKLSTALEIVSRTSSFRPSNNDDDWLGHGIYFWEYAPQRAWEWAAERYKGEVAVLGAMIRLGNERYPRDMADEAAARPIADSAEAMTSRLDRVIARATKLTTEQRASALARAGLIKTSEIRKTAAKLATARR